MNKFFTILLIGIIFFCKAEALTKEESEKAKKKLLN